MVMCLDTQRTQFCIQLLRVMPNESWFAPANYIRMGENQGAKVERWKEGRSFPLTHHSLFYR